MACGIKRHSDQLNQNDWLSSLTWRHMASEKISTVPRKQPGQKRALPSRYTSPVAFHQVANIACSVWTPLQLCIEPRAMLLVLGAKWDVTNVSTVWRTKVIAIATLTKETKTTVKFVTVYIGKIMNSFKDPCKSRRTKERAGSLFLLPRVRKLLILCAVKGKQTSLNNAQPTRKINY